MVFDQADVGEDGGSENSARRRMRAYMLFMSIRANSVHAESKHDDMPVIETRRVVTIGFDKPSGAMKKRGSTKKNTIDGGCDGGRPTDMKCTVYELDTSV